MDLQNLGESRWINFQTWNRRIDSFLSEKGFVECKNEYEIYVNGIMGTSKRLQNSKGK